MFYKSTNGTVSGFIAGVKLYPLFYMMLNTLNLNQEGWRNFLAAFPLGSVEEVGLFGIWRMLT